MQLQQFVELVRAARFTDAIAFARSTLTPSLSAASPSPSPSPARFEHVKTAAAMLAVGNRTRLSKLQVRASSQCTALLVMAGRSCALLCW